MKKHHLFGLLILNLLIGTVWFFSYREMVSSAELPPLPQVELKYSSLEPTNQDVTAELFSSDPIHVTNNLQSFVYTFHNNGSFIFEYQDVYSRNLSVEATVTNIDKTAPVALLENLPEASTYETTAAITVNGLGVTHYRYRLDDQPESTEFTIDQPLSFTGLAIGVHTLTVSGRDAVGNWQPHEQTTAFSWEIKEMTYAEKMALRQRTTPLEQSQKAIEVSINEQYLWAYDGNELFLHTPITTGASAKGLATETGSFKITQKHQNKWFEGGYFSKYWMRFNKGMGIHDASWRRNFGSQDYKWTGSHGCVNVPPDLTPTIYDWAEIGTKVVVF